MLPIFGAKILNIFFFQYLTQIEFCGPTIRFLPQPDVMIFQRSSRKILYNEKEEPIEGVISLADALSVLKVDCKIMWARATNLGFYWDLKARYTVAS